MGPFELPSWLAWLLILLPIVFPSSISISPSNPSRLWSLLLQLLKQCSGIIHPILLFRYRSNRSMSFNDMSCQHVTRTCFIIITTACLFPNIVSGSHLLTQRGMSHGISSPPRQAFFLCSVACWHWVLTCYFFLNPNLKQFHHLLMTQILKTQDHCVTVLMPDRDPLLQKQMLSHFTSIRSTLPPFPFFHSISLRLSVFNCEKIKRRITINKSRKENCSFIVHIKSEQYPFSWQGKNKVSCNVELLKLIYNVYQYNRI